MAPTQRAFERMRRALFEPFEIKKWFVLGFTAWLAGLLDGGGGGSGGGDWNSDGEPGDFEINQVGPWIEENLLLAVAIALGVGLVLMAIVAVVVALLWVSSRGKFMFLDNAVHDRAVISMPWKTFQREGNSLFRWRLGLALGGLILLGGCVAVVVASVVWMEAGEDWGWLAVIIPAGLMGVAFILVLTYLSVLLEHFIIPIMHRNRVLTGTAIGIFLGLHRRHWPEFLLYFLWMILLGLATLMGIVAVGVVTCCIGFILMWLPYIGSVFLLPVLLFFRMLGPEYLRQFGPDYDVWASSGEHPPPPLSNQGG